MHQQYRIEMAAVTVDRSGREPLAARTGWFWWMCRAGLLPGRPPKGPFATSYQRVSQRREPVVYRGLAVSVLAGPPKNRQRLLHEIRRRIS
jgi:hypothetical protein